MCGVEIVSSGSPFSGNFFKQSTEAIGGFIRWIAELIVSKNWFSLSVLLAVTVRFLLNPWSGLAFELLSLDLDAQPLPGWYAGAFWVTMLGLLSTALVIAVQTRPKAVAPAPEDITERKAIKGLRPFSLDDAEVYTQLPLPLQLRDCVDALTSDIFRFGILMGESGCGKTSFLQAGVWPLLTPEKANCLGIYIRFNDQKPIKTIAKALAEQLKLPLEKLLSWEGPQDRLLVVLQQAAASQDYPLVLLFDQHVQGAPALEFLGHPAQTAISAAELALRYKALLIPFYGVRGADGLSFDCVMEAPIAHSDPITMTQAMNDSMSARIRSTPGQWFWVARRWRADP